MAGFNKMRAWNIKDLAISLNAVPLDDGGYAEDEVMTLEWDEEQFAIYKRRSSSLAPGVSLSSIDALFSVDFATSPGPVVAENLRESGPECRCRSGSIPVGVANATCCIIL